MCRTKKRVNRRCNLNTYHYNSSSYQLGEIIVSKHAIERFKLRAKRNKTDSEISGIIINQMHLSTLLSISDKEEKYIYNGLIFCVSRTSKGVIVKTVLLTKEKQMKNFSNKINEIDYDSFDCYNKVSFA